MLRIQAAWHYHALLALPPSSPLGSAGPSWMRGAAVLIHAALADGVVGEVRTNGTYYYVNSAPETPGKIGGHMEWFTPELARESWERTEALL